MYLFYNLCKIHYWLHAKLIICNDFDITDMPFRKHEVPLQMLIKHEIQNGNTISKLLIYTLHWGKFFFMFHTKWVWHYVCKRRDLGPQNWFNTATFFLLRWLYQARKVVGDVYVAFLLFVFVEFHVVWFGFICFI